MKKPQILRDADRVILSCFYGIAIPHQPSLADGVYGPIRSEKVLKFNRKALRKIGKTNVQKVDPRMIGSDDTMIVKVGKPGSRERVEALAIQYANIAEQNQEVSPFGWEG